METKQSSSKTVEFLWKIPVIAIVYFVGAAISGALINVMQLPWPEVPASAESITVHLLRIVANLLLASCLVPLAAGIQGSTDERWLILAGFTYVSFGVNNQLEGATYSTIGGTATNLLFFILPCLAVAAAAVILIRPPERSPLVTTVFTERAVSGWWWRAVLAVVAFPVIFFIFGAMAFPLVADTYAQPESALVVPGPLAVFRTVFVRSLFFLVATVPVLMVWSRSRRGLILALGAAFTVMVGAVGLLMAQWLPPAMRAVHGIEILADSMVYAWVLVALLVPRISRTHPEKTSAAAAT